MTSQASDNTILALDVGAARIGVALAHNDVAIASPLTWLPNDDQIFTSIQDLINDHKANSLIIGLPRNLSSQDTDQTRTVRQFVDELKEHVSTPMFWQDEALTSQKAETELKARKKPFEKGDIDALAACFILEDYLDTEQKVAA